jgi:VWFA-related protein
VARWAALVVAVALVVAGLQSAAIAQQEGEPQITVDAVDSGQFPDVNITVTVRDDSGVPVSGVPLSAFALSAGETRLELSDVATATNTDGGVSVVLAFDVSGSMSGEPLETAKAAGKSLIAQLGPNDLVAVLAFNDSVVIVQPFTSDVSALTAAIDSLAASRDTALYQAVSESVALAQSGDSSRRAVVLLSDGTDHGGVSTSTRESSLAAAGSAGAPVFAVGLGDQIDQEYLTAISSSTSGALAIAPNPASLEGLYTSIGEVLRRQHLITFDASPIQEPTTLRLQVEYGGASATTEFAFEPPPGTIPPEPVDEPVDEPVPEVPEDPVVEPPQREPAGPPIVEPAAEAGGSAIPLLLVGVGSPTLLVAIGLLVFFMVRRRRRAAVVAGSLPEQSLAALLRRPRAGGPALVSAAGEPAEIGGPADARPSIVAQIKVPSKGRQASYPVDGSPLTIGYPPDCDVVLPADGSERHERVRVWQRDGRFMLHNLSRGGRVTVAGKPVTWLVLEDGDAIDIGGCQVLFSSP